jgi:hypothetical protein
LEEARKLSEVTGSLIFPNGLWVSELVRDIGSRYHEHQKKFGANIAATIIGSGTTAPRLRSEHN